jgi:hypothetical protein
MQECSSPIRKSRSNSRWSLGTDRIADARAPRTSLLANHRWKNKEKPRRDSRGFSFEEGRLRPLNNQETVDSSRVEERERNLMDLNAARLPNCTPFSARNPPRSIFTEARLRNFTMRFDCPSESVRSWGAALAAAVTPGRDASRERARLQGLGTGSKTWMRCIGAPGRGGSERSRRERILNSPSTLAGQRGAKPLHPFCVMRFVA